MPEQAVSSFRPVVRDLHPGMGQAVAERTVLRKVSTEDGHRLSSPELKAGADWRWESWGEVAQRVAIGNALLSPDKAKAPFEQVALTHHIAKATLLMSGRHLQHGDETQPTRNQEVFTNCGSAETQLLTAEYGATTLGAIAGETVTVRCADGQWRPAEAKSYGQQKLYRLVFRKAGSGPALRREERFTRNHRWLLADGMVTDDIQPGDRLAAAPVQEASDDNAVVHGLLFGDGTAHKSRSDTYRTGVSFGRTYASIRVCKSDAVRDTIHGIFDNAGYRYTKPLHAKGDRVYYMGKFPFAKELPCTTDAEYIASFIRGWWLADGNKTDGSALVISTCCMMAADWLVTHAPFAGYTVISHTIKPRKSGDGSYANGKDLHVIRLRSDVQWVLESIEPDKTEEVFCVEEPVTSSFTLASGMLTGNCSTSATSFTEFLLLLNGSGVGRCYDDDMMLVNWDYAPAVRCVLDTSHADFDWSAHESVRDARHKYGAGKDVMWHEVEDSREGWAKAIEVWENAAFEKIHKDKLLVLDFSSVRCKGSPIGGMQDRPASGPVPLMNAIQKAASIKGAGLSPWLQTMYVDHYLAECVLVGGARRAARMATKFWKDRTVLDFIRVKRPIEFHELSMAEVIALRRMRAEHSLPPLQAFLWSSNNSVTVDSEFWRHVENGLRGVQWQDQATGELQAHAMRVWRAVTECAYGDGTGEPGLINVDKLVRNDEGWEGMEDGAFVGSAKYQVEEDTRLLLSKLAKRAKAKQYNMIVNPCAEIALTLLGGYCVIADVVPFHADSLAEACDAFRVATRALIRVNLMDCLYRRETRRTNRIGVGMTGVHEFAWKFFGLGFRDLVSQSRYAIRKIATETAKRIGTTDRMSLVNNLIAGELNERVAAFWLCLSQFKQEVRHEAEAYAKELGVNVPHTDTTIKPAGTTSKLFGLTEGWHLPSMREFLRWVQFRNDDPLVTEYAKNGYPTKQLKTYSGTTIVGFPTQPTICSLGMGDKLVTAAEATPEEQYQWMLLGEEFWIRGVDEELQLLQPDHGNQISYTLKYDPQLVGFESFCAFMFQYQQQVRACSVMPQEDKAAYEYQPEQAVTKVEYEAIASAIDATLHEEVAFEHIDCSTGACPISFDESGQHRGERA